MSLQPHVDKDIIDNAARLMQTFMGKVTWPTVAVSQTNRETEAAKAYADKHCAKRAAEYRRDPLKCAEVLSEWLHSPAGRHELMVMLDQGDALHFVWACKTALEPELLEVAHQDLCDEYTGDSDAR